MSKLRNWHKARKQAGMALLDYWISTHPEYAPIWWQQSLLKRIPPKRPFIGKMPKSLQEWLFFPEQSIYVDHDGGIYALNRYNGEDIPGEVILPPLPEMRYLPAPPMCP